MNAPLTINVNGCTVERAVDPRTHLADFLREELNLTGTHLGCEHGVCGACTVIIDGEPARSCIGFAASMQSADVVTIEGLDEDEITAELRVAFNQEHALQCGFCTPGVLITARDLVLRLSDSDERRIRLGLSGNLCRCTGYVGIVRAIMKVIAARRGRGIAPVVRGDGRLGPVGAHAGAATVTSAAVSGLSSQRPRAARRIAPATDFAPAHSFEQEFTVCFPADAVFAFFADVPEVAACLPGAFVSDMPAPGHVEGGMRVKLGPISANFGGTATITRDEAGRTGTIRGAGADGRSSTQGEISYRIVDGGEPGTARVKLGVGYTLKGPLAQFGRPGIVRDVAQRLVEDFASNLEARLAGRTVESVGASGLNPIRLLMSLVRARVGVWFNRVRDRGASTDRN